MADSADRRNLCVAVFVVSFLLLRSPAFSRATNSEESANDLARAVLHHEAKAQKQDQSHWMCRVETETARGKQVDEVVETKYGNIKRHIIVNGRPLTGHQAEAEDKRVQNLAHNPGELRKSMKNEKADSERSQKMLEMLPKALTFTYGERKGDTVELHFAPNPNFRPSSLEDRVLQALEGNMWINTRQQRLVALNGQLKHEVKFGYGMLGHLNRGGKFEVTQAEVAPGYWELTVLNVDMRGKALFFKTISEQQRMRRTDFHQVSDNLTLAQAAEMLLKQPIVAQKETAPR